MNTYNWSLGNGQSISFNVYTPDTKWNNVAGLYIFAYITGSHWLPLYIGQTDDFSARLPNHDRWEEARRKGATHIHAKSVQEAATRQTWEKMLIQTYQPILNKQLL